MTTHESRHEIELDGTWAYGPGILHGGFLLELLAGHAVTDTHPHPLSTTAHFLSSPKIGPAELHVTRLREGRSTTVTRVALVQEKVCLDVVVTAGRLPATSSPVYADLAVPSLPEPEQCVATEVEWEDGQHNGIAVNLDIRLDPETAGWSPGAVPGKRPVQGTSEVQDAAEVRGWLRSATGRENDALFLLTLADGFPPVTFPLGIKGWAPTVQLTVNVRALPAPGWVRGVQRAHLVSGGWFDEECQLWDSTGALVVQATQLAAYRHA